MWGTKNIHWCTGIALLCMTQSWGSSIRIDSAKQDKTKGETLTLPPYIGPKKRLAVVNMEVKDDGSWNQWLRTVKASSGITTVDDVGRRMTEMLTTALDSTGRFTLLERAAINDIKDEIRTGEELGNEKTAVKRGNVLGAQILVRCAVTEFESKSKQNAGGFKLGPIALGGGSGESKVVIDVRMYDASSSKILYTAKAAGTSKSSAVVGGVSVGSFSGAAGEAKKDPIELATRNAIETAVYLICKKMQDVPWEGKVAAVTGKGDIVVNRGSQDGIKEGNIFYLFKPGEDLKDPDTGESLGRDKDVLLGRVEVIWVGEKACRIKYSGSAKVEKGFVLKLNED